MADELIIWRENENCNFKGYDRRGRLVCELDVARYHKEVGALFYRWYTYNPATGECLARGTVKDTGPCDFQYEGPFIKAQDEAEAAYRQWQEQNQ